MSDGRTGSVPPAQYPWNSEEGQSGIDLSNTRSSYASRNLSSSESLIAMTLRAEFFMNGKPEKPGLPPTPRAISLDFTRSFSALVDIAPEDFQSDTTTSTAESTTQLQSTLKNVMSKMLSNGSQLSQEKSETTLQLIISGKYTMIETTSTKLRLLKGSNKVMVRPIFPEKKSSLILTTEKPEGNAEVGEVIQSEVASIKVGDKIHFQKLSQHNLELEDGTHYLLDEEDILGVYTP